MNFKTESLNQQQLLKIGPLEILGYYSLDYSWLAQLYKHKKKTEKKCPLTGFSTFRIPREYSMEMPFARCFFMFIVGPENI